MTVGIFAFQVWGSYELIRNVFRWLALTLLAYVGAAILAKPDLIEVIKGTLIPTIGFDQKFLSLLVAVIGTTLSAYLYTWQSNQEVEEEIAMGRRRLSQRQGATKKELKATKKDVISGMFFSNVVMYFMMKALVFSGIVQGFSTPPLLLLIMLMTNNARSWATAGHTVPGAERPDATRLHTPNSTVGATLA